MMDFGHAAVAEQFADLIPASEQAARTHLFSPSVDSMGNLDVSL
jgi:hypothetical protein